MRSTNSRDQRGSPPGKAQAKHQGSTSTPPSRSPPNAASAGGGPHAAKPHPTGRKAPTLTRAASPPPAATKKTVKPPSSVTGKVEKAEEVDEHQLPDAGKAAVAATTMPVTKADGMEELKGAKEASTVSTHGTGGRRPPMRSASSKGQRPPPPGKAPGKAQGKPQVSTSTPPSRPQSKGATAPSSTSPPFRSGGSPAKQPAGRKSPTPAASPSDDYHRYQLSDAGLAALASATAKAAEVPPADASRSKAEATPPTSQRRSPAPPASQDPQAMRGAEDLPPTHVDAAEEMDGAAAKQEVVPTGPAHRRARIRRPTEGRRMATDGSEPQEQEGDRLGPPLTSISSDHAWVPRAPTPPASGGKSVGFSTSAKEEEGAKEEGTAEEEEVAAAEIGADARVSAAAALEVLPERAAAEAAVEVEMVEEATAAAAAATAAEADEAEAKQEEVVGEAAVKEAEKEAEMAQEVDGANVLPDDLWSAGCAA